MSRATPSLRYRVKAETASGIALDLIGEWLDLAAYYSGADGNAWVFHATSGGFTNAGPLPAFRDTFAARYRGALFPS